MYGRRWAADKKLSVLCGPSFIPALSGTLQKRNAEHVAASVEASGYDLPWAEANIFNILPPLSCGPISSSTTVVTDESESDRDHVLLISGWAERGWDEATRVYLHPQCARWTW